MSWSTWRPTMSPWSDPSTSIAVLSTGPNDVRHTGDGQPTGVQDTAMPASRSPLMYISLAQP